MNNVWSVVTPAEHLQYCQHDVGRKTTRGPPLMIAPLLGGAVLCGTLFSPSFAAGPLEWFDALRPTLSRIYERPPARIVTLPLASRRCAIDVVGIGSCSAAAKAACHAEQYLSGRPLETITYQACSSISAYLSTRHTCKLEHRVDKALFWQPK